MSYIVKHLNIKALKRKSMGAPQPLESGGVRAYLFNKLGVRP